MKSLEFTPLSFHIKKAEKEKEIFDHTLQDQLVKVFAKEFPDIIKENLDVIKQGQSSLKIFESNLYDKDFLDNIRKYGIDLSSIEKCNNDGTYTVSVLSRFHKNHLPEGYAYKGGAARALLFRSFHIDENAIPRDIDIVRLSKEEPYEGADDKISQQYMSDDYAYGDGVEIIENKEEYFDTRDLTINEILATDDKIIISKECLADTVRHILRITEFEKEKNRNLFGGGLPYKLMAKTIRMHSESILKYGEDKAFKIDPEQNYTYERSFITPFYLAVHLDRSFQQGENIAEEFTKQLKENKQIPEYVNGPIDLASYLNNLMNHEPFYYRYAPVDQYKLEQEWFKNNRRDNEENASSD